MATPGWRACSPHCRDLPFVVLPSCDRLPAAPKDEDRQAVGTAVTERMHQLGLTVAEINRRTGLSETTDILHGRAHENVVTESPLEKNLAQLVRELADTLRGDVSELKGDVSELKGVVYRIDGKVDAVIAGRHASSGDVR